MEEMDKLIKLKTKKIIEQTNEINDLEFKLSAIEVYIKSLDLIDKKVKKDIIDIIKGKHDQVYTLNNLF